MLPIVLPAYSVREIILVLFVGIHPVRMARIPLANRHSLRDGVFLIREINTADFKLDVLGSCLLHEGDFSLHIGDRNSKIVVHWRASV